MASLDRDRILDDLLARFVDAMPELHEATRRDTSFDQIKKPGLVLSTTGEGRDELGKWTIDVEVRVNVEVKDSDKSPETSLRKLIDAIDDALDARDGETPGYGMRTTLGNPQVESVAISGPIEMAQGLGGVGEAVIPVRITAFEP